jgi:hypothetical protein
VNPHRAENSNLAIKAPRRLRKGLLRGAPVSDTTATRLEGSPVTLAEVETTSVGVRRSIVGFALVHGVAEVNGCRRCGGTTCYRWSDKPTCLACGR